MTTITATVDHAIRFDTAGLPGAFIRDLERALTYPNPAYFKQQRMGYWTGDMERTVKTFSTRHTVMEIHRGAVDKVISAAQAHGIYITFDDRRLEVPHEFKSKIELRPYQEPAVQALARRVQGVLRGPCGVGKTAMMLKLIEILRQKTLVVVWNSVLMEQWIERVHDFFGMKAGIIGQGKVDIRPITIGMQQTLMRDVTPYVGQFGAIIVDETHRLAANSWQGVVNKFPAKYRQGCSADESRKDGLDFLVYDTLGPLVYEVKEQELKDAGKTMPVKIRVVPTGYMDEMYANSEGPARNHVGMVNQLVADEERNNLILKIVLREHDPQRVRPMLILVERRAACEFWHRELNARGIKTGLMLGGAANKRETEETRRGLTTGEFQCAVSTTVADEALDVPELARLFILTPTARHHRRMTQQVGRLKRPAPGKVDAVCYYFLDEMFLKDVKTIKRHFENVEMWDPAAHGIY